MTARENLDDLSRKLADECEATAKALRSGDHVSACACLDCVRYLAAERDKALISLGAEMAWK